MTKFTPKPLSEVLAAIEDDSTRRVVAAEIRNWITPILMEAVMAVDKDGSLEELKAISDGMQAACRG